MMKKLACALAVASLSMMGCSWSVCDDLADSTKTWNEKISGCPDLADSKLDEPSDSEIKQCEDNLDSCSDADKKAISAFSDCLSKLDKCSPSTEQAFGNSILACAAPLANVSENCGSTGSSVPSTVKAFLKAHKAQ